MRHGRGHWWAAPHRRELDVVVVVTNEHDYRWIVIFILGISILGIFIIGIFILDAVEVRWSDRLLRFNAHFFAIILGRTTVTY